MVLGGASLALSGIFIIATAHDEYREREFPPGSTVIDPWRMIDDQPGVSVRRLGDNRPALISILLPSRGRPLGVDRVVNSVRKTATHLRFIEFVIRLDSDDASKDEYLQYEGVRLRYLQRPRELLSLCWNECAEEAYGEILMHAGDDIEFLTPGWDQMVRDEFAGSTDKILFVHGDDLGPHGREFGTHGFVHQRWVDTVGYFLPPLFSSDWNDVWLNDVANTIGRRRLLPFVTEHHHYTFGKAARDQTHADREERGIADGVVELYKRTKRERAIDVHKLQAVLV